MKPLLRPLADPRVSMLLLVVTVAAGWSAWRSIDHALPRDDGGGPGYLLASPMPPELRARLAARGIDPEPFGVEGIHDRPHGGRP